jgi:hypothetical protein
MESATTHSWTFLIILAGKMNSAAMKGTSHHEYNCGETLFAALLAGYFRNHNMNQYLRDGVMATIIMHT